VLGADGLQTCTIGLAKNSSHRSNFDRPARVKAPVAVTNALPELADSASALNATLMLFTRTDLSEIESIQHSTSLCVNSNAGNADLFFLNVMAATQEAQSSLDQPLVDDR